MSVLVYKKFAHQPKHKIKPRKKQCLGNILLIISRYNCAAIKESTRSVASRKQRKPKDTELSTREASAPSPGFNFEA
jgi:hypothetical protein